MPAHRSRTRTLAVLATLATAGVAVAVPALVTPDAVAAPPGCSTMSTAIHQSTRPQTGGSLLTGAGFDKDGTSATLDFTDDNGVLFSAGAEPSPGTTAVHRLWHPRTGDFVWIGGPGERAGAVSRYGYLDQGVQFHARTAKGTGCIPVHRFVKGSAHRFSLSADVEVLQAAGWRHEGIFFYAAPSTPTDPPSSPTPEATIPSDSATSAPTATATATAEPSPTAPEPTSPSAGDPPPAEGTSTFSFVVIPDTQTWTGLRDPRFSNATAWIVSQEESRNIEWVQHTGDVVNWGWLDRTQYDVASTAMTNLERAEIPYALTIGNHDTRVVGIGGGSYVFQNNKQDCLVRFGAAECKAALLNRHTEEFNEYFTADRYGNVGGAFEPGKVDNIFQTFDAGNKKWLVLTLELWPRAEAVAWANEVVAQHADHNVIVQTHSYLNWNGTIYQGSDYGSTSPKYVYDNLISKHDNIKMVFSGHVGESAHRTDTTPSGNVVHSFLMNSIGSGNSVRVMTVDTATGQFSSDVYNQAAGSWVESRQVKGAITVEE